MHRRLGRWMIGMLLAAVLAGSGCHGRPSASEAVASGGAARDSSFARLVEKLSEPGGYFDTDNLISNERSYLHALDALRERGVKGGAYLGVGPDQNFSYIAQVRPRLAFIVDVRRDNLLQHLFFKALFAEARTRLDYLCLLHGRPAPEEAAAWEEASIEDLVAYVDEAPPTEAEVARARMRQAVQHAGLKLSDADLGTIDGIHRRFIAAGLDLRFQSHGRAPRAYYPTFRDLLLEKDRAGRFGSYLADEDDFRFLKKMQAQDRIVPVVGDLGGTHALAAIGALLTARGEVVSAFYTSNVEFYLMQGRRFDRFIENLRALPIDEHSVLIRSYFNRYGADHPETVPGYASTQLLQSIGELLDGREKGGYRSYYDLIWQPQPAGR